MKPWPSAYRLSGELFLLHVDDALGKTLELLALILHGDIVGIDGSHVTKPNFTDAQTASPPSNQKVGS
jgi:hypothetical protein